MCLNPIPCDGCTAVIYCSELCIAEDWNKYHEYECSIVDHILNLVSTVLNTSDQSSGSNILIAMKICMIALKQFGGIIPLVGEVETLSQTKDMQNEHCIVNGFYSSESYRSVHYMINKSEINSTFPINKFIQCTTERCYYIIIASVYVLATRTTIFNRKYEGELSTVMQLRMPKFFASLVLRHFELFHDSQQFASIEDDHNFVKSISVCPLLFILNHSCNPNSVKFMLKEHQVLLAIDEIKKGQEINVSFFRKPLFDGDVERMMTHDYVLCICQCNVPDTVSNRKPQFHPELVSFELSEKDGQKLKEISSIYYEIMFTANFQSPPKPRSASGFLNWDIGFIS